MRFLSSHLFHSKIWLLTKVSAEANIISLDRPLINTIDACTQVEWLVTNGIGGYASGTVANLLTRRYHGLLLAALEPPLKSKLMRSKKDEEIIYKQNTYLLGSNQFKHSDPEINGIEYIEKFYLDGTIPTWHYRINDALLEKRIWMEQGENTTYIQYRLLSADKPLKFKIKTYANIRGCHNHTKAPHPHYQIVPIEKGILVIENDVKARFFLLADSKFEFHPRYEWTQDYFLQVESDRGQEECDDHLYIGDFFFILKPGNAFTFTITTEDKKKLNIDRSFDRQKSHEADLLKHLPSNAPDWQKQLTLAANQFIVTRPVQSDLDGKSIIAGYHWFGDWGRDTMISLSGLTLSTKQYTTAKKILLTFAEYVSRGMLPNRFPDVGCKPEYNTVDATLWYFEAIHAFYQEAKDLETVEKLYPTLVQIINWHIKGTRYGIKMDHNDHLITAGKEGVQLTWMDAKIDGWVVTPREGKAVEINALWYNALKIMAEFSILLGKEPAIYQRLAKQVKESFQHFWNKDLNACYDVIDGAVGFDPKIRPNQLFAVSLTHSPLSQEQQKLVVDLCQSSLYTAFGLRSLAPTDPEYKGKFEGDMLARDSAYHQGTVWAWLIGPFITAYYKVYQDKEAAWQLLKPILENLKHYGIGSINEIFTGDAPHRPEGCIAQAWSVAEILRVWDEIN